jgi:hypothetical protein
MGILEKISEIEKEIARTQKNKGMMYVQYVDVNLCSMLKGIICLRYASTLRQSPT